MTVDAYEEIRRHALEQIDSSGIDPDSDPAELRTLLIEAVDDYQRRAHLGEGRSLGAWVGTRLRASVDPRLGGFWGDWRLDRVAHVVE